MNRRRERADGLPYRVYERRGARLYSIGYKKPDGTYLGRSKLGDALKPIEKGHLVTMRNWNTIEKAAAL